MSAARLTAAFNGVIWGSGSGGCGGRGDDDVRGPWTLGGGGDADGSWSREQQQVSRRILDHWLDVFPRTREMVRQTGFHVGAIEWRLGAEVDAGTWAIAQVRAIDRQMYLKRFYLGITSRPGWRWSDAEAGHRAKGYEKMFILALSDDSDEIEQGEIDSIALFRRYDNRGCWYQPGHLLCQNRNPGGEGGMRNGPPPYVLYLCVGWNPRLVGPLSP